ncbi:MAG: PD-(D/E)XK nuclease family protein [Halobacteria archaeon]
MPLYQAKSPDELYNQVSDYDLVLTPDPSLSSALNRRINQPHFGTYATTPRRHAAGRKETSEDRTLFLKLLNRGYSWKELGYTVGNILQCWEHQGNPEAILEYQSYVDENTPEILKAIKNLDTTSSQLQSHQIPEHISLAVVGENQFTELEKTILPSNPDGYDSYSLFTNESRDTPFFHVFNSKTEIIDAVLDTVTQENSENVAVVLDSGSEYSALIESAFETEGIPFYGGPGFKDKPHNRGYLNFLKSSLQPSIKVKHLQPLTSHLHIDIDIVHNEKHLGSLELSELEGLKSLLSSVGSLTFGEAVTEYEGLAETSMERFRTELDNLKLHDLNVTESRVNDLEFYLDKYNVPVDRENEGVLLADAKSSGFVDRPVVFHLGLSESWTHKPPKRPWIDTEELYERYLDQFQLLLQSGNQQYYLVQDTSGGQQITPCLYFNELIESELEGFSDLPSTKHSRVFEKESQGFAKQETDVEPCELDAVSKSSLNNYVNSPRDYFFDRVLDTPDKVYFTEGNLYHDFAELYANHPEFVDDQVIEEAVELMLDNTRMFYHETEKPLKKRRYRIGLENIVEFLDENTPTDLDFISKGSSWGDNFFANHYDLEIDSGYTEKWFDDTGLSVKGKIDLIHSANHILDYKSGRKKTARQRVKASQIDPIADKPEFQAVLYLTYYRSVRPGEPLKFTYFHFLDNIDDIIHPDSTPDIDDTLTTIQYYPYSFDEYISSRDAYETLLDGYNDCVETFEDLGFSRYSEIMEALVFPETRDREELRDSDFISEFISKVEENTGSDIDVEKGCDQAMRKLNGVRKKTYFKEDVDAFEEFLDICIEELNEYRRGEERFPVEGKSGEPEYRRIEYRDLLLKNMNGGEM